MTPSEHHPRFRVLSFTRRPVPSALALPILALFLSGCVGSVSDSVGPAQYEYPDRGTKRSSRGEGIGSISEGFNLLGSSNDDAGSSAKIGVNALLWRASLDTVSFMPLASADPFGGVIITDWYSDPASPKERFKATVYILDKRLRADAVRVSLFRQQNQNGRWVDTQASAEAQRTLEDQILTRARQLRIARTEG